MQDWSPVSGHLEIHVPLGQRSHCSLLSAFCDSSSDIYTRIYRNKKKRSGIIWLWFTSEEAIFDQVAHRSVCILKQNRNNSETKPKTKSNQPTNNPQTCERYFGGQNTVLTQEIEENMFFTWSFCRCREESYLQIISV